MNLSIAMASANNSRLDDIQDEAELEIKEEAEEEKFEPTLEIKEESDEEGEFKSSEDKISPYEQNEDIQDSKYYLKKLEARPTDRVITFLCALAFIKEKEWDQALVYIKKTQILDPDYEKARVNEALADIHFNLKNQQWEKVQDYYDKSINEHLNDIERLDSDLERDEVSRIKYNIG